jgi:hypothetical protein
MVADVLGAWEVEAQQVAAVIGHNLILTRVVLTGGAAGLIEPRPTPTAGRKPAVSSP